MTTKKMKKAMPPKPKTAPKAKAAAPRQSPDAQAAALKPAAPTRTVATPQPLRGMRDILPTEQKYWRRCERAIESIVRAYGYERIETPVLEETSLFVRSAGKQSDVVEKEMFSFLDKGNENVSLRPEGTAPLVRAYVNHGMVNLPQPVKLYYVGPMFRYERPQHGRFREHHQFGVEVFGEQHPILDAEIVLLAHLFYKELGIKTTVSINSLGCNVCRPAYVNELVAYYRPRRSQLCEDCKRRMAKNPLRLLDCKEPGCQAVKEGAPHIVDFLDEECKKHFMSVLEYLDDLQVPYVLNPHLVRGFDYYTRTVFEILLAEEAEQAQGEQAQAQAQGAGQSQVALGGGGRYDNLVEQMSGRATPACGFGIGLERAILQMKALSIDPGEDFQTEIFLAQLGDAARRKSFSLFEELRAAGIHAAANFSKNSLKGQLEIANRLGAKYTVILGQKEVLDGTILIRDMESGMQEIVDYTKAVGEMKKKLGKT